MGLSGGMDSSTLLAYLLDKDYDVTACVFTYGSKHNAYENRAAKSIVEHYRNLGFPVAPIYMDLTEIFKPFKSDLLLSGGAIPEGHYEAENMKSTVVPGRNLMFISIMAGIAESIDARLVALGVHAGDHAIYPDCREDFIHSANNTVMLSSDGRVAITAPFQSFNKADILHAGYILENGLFPPYHLTRTCYKDQELACGKCGSCQERLEAFQKIGIVDPIEYE